MAKKTEVVEEVAVSKIALLDADFGREDLNLLRDKVNELVERANS